MSKQFPEAGEFENKYLAGYSKVQDKYNVIKDKIGTAGVQFLIGLGQARQTDIDYEKIKSNETKNAEKLKKMKDHMEKEYKVIEEHDAFNEKILEKLKEEKRELMATLALRESAILEELKPKLILEVNEVYKKKI